MKYWFDTEFIEDGRTIDLLSIGIVAEDGREFYREASWTDHSRANEGVKENVLPHLRGCPSDVPLPAHHDRALCFLGGLAPHDNDACIIRSRLDMAQEIIAFCNPALYKNPEFWAYYADYDWVVLCQIFGTMMELPSGWPRYCRDLQQEADQLQEWMRWFNEKPQFKIKLPKQTSTEHHALADARWNREAWGLLAMLSGGKYLQSKYPPTNIDTGEQE